jgi:NADPH:quinone reductase-like Zn-dependent oxidoreductase
MAKHLGAYVIATASAGKAERLRQLGADEVVDYIAVDFTQVVQPVDVVLDLVGGEYAVRSIAVLVPGGLLLEIPSGQDVPTDERLAATGTRAMALLVEPDGAAPEQLTRLTIKAYFTSMSPKQSAWSRLRTCATTT